MHHISTDEVFGALGKTGKFDETTPYDPHSPYSASKASSDHIVRAYFDTYGLPVTISNCSNNYGPYQFPEKLVPLFIIKALHNGLLPIYGDGMQVRDWLYVEDNCKAIDLVRKKGEKGEIYNVGAENERTNLEITCYILQELNKPKSLIQHVEDRPGHDCRYGVESSKIRELGWKPVKSQNFENSMSETIQWYLKNKWWWKKLI